MNATHTGAALAVSLCAMLAPAIGHAAEPQTNPIPAAMRQALQRDLGLKPSQLQAYLATEHRAMRLQAEARAGLGAHYAGSWLERDAAGDYRLILGVTDRKAVSRMRQSGDEVRVFKHSAAELDAAQSQLDQAHRGLTAGLMRKDGPRVQAWNVDLPNNRIILTIDPNAQEAAIELIARSGIDARMVQIVTSAQRPKPQHDLRGGDRYLTPDSWCSTGFSAFRGNTPGFVTAGHCGTVNMAVRGTNQSPIGHFAYSTFPNADHAWVQNTQPNLWHILPWVYNYAGVDIDVRGGLEAPIGAAVCRSGNKTGYHCGTVQAKQVTVDYGPQYGVVKGLTQSNACAGFGDSGGAVITPSAEAQGVYSGGHFSEGRDDNCGDPAPQGYFQPLQPILNAYDLVLRTVPSCGRLNPRDWRETNGTLTSCDQRFTLAIQGDGNLVLYKQNVGAIWANHVYGSGHTLHMQTDGNLTVRDGAGQTRWASNTGGKRGAVLFVQNDGNVVVYDHERKPLWQTNTAGR
ncbi:alpha-lytic protease prodomain-containing protein [Lysobacter sp. Root983]|uniref:alpha-lytic protease prodomain-containing protein n=1 Tax=Lysobacter sp. Root983 TaxID=1736613 RepID=UPI00070E1996|nr:alpha-lytic protease prodomain-containing protein [Lysobacter sp. Root983]KRD77214.1 hypothetical protein ASE43_08625 [Lysobacter sp. Root983]